MDAIGVERGERHLGGIRASHVEADLSSPMPHHELTAGE